jgi:hypothetical protein
MNKPVLPLQEKGNECRKILEISGGDGPHRKRKDHLDQLSYRNIWEVI